MKRASGSLAVAVLLAVGAAVAAGLAWRARGGGTCVVLVTIDTLRADRVGCYGYAKARTPNLDRLAAEGALYADAAAPAPLTLPSHATILTGLLPPRHGLRDNDTPRPLAPPAGRDFLTLAEELRGAGWSTAAFVSGSPLSPRWGLDAGFDTYDAPPDPEPGSPALGERPGSATVERALEWLRAREDRRPFLLWVHLFDPHFPYRAPGGSSAAADSPEAYDEEVAYADAQVGRLLDALRERGLYGNAVVVACADHGEGLGEHGESTHGHFLYRSTMRVPLIVRAPGRSPPGTRVEGPVSLADVLPTVLEAARRPLPVRPLDGRPLPRVAGEAPEGTTALQYGETLYGSRAFRWAQAVALREGAIRTIDAGGGRREVFDLSADPGETRPLDPAAGAGAAEKAWSVFTSPPRGAAASPAAGPDLAPIGYVSGYAPLVVRGAEENGKRPLPSAPFVRRFEGVVAMVERARGLDQEEALATLDLALAVLGELDREDPANPAVPFWQGRVHRQKAKTRQDSVFQWYEAFARFQEAGRRGYAEPRTVSAMMEAAFHAGKHGDMLAVATDAVEKARMDGDASFWAWVALARFQGRVDSRGQLPPEFRASFEEAVRKAEERARSPEERARVAEIRTLLK